MARTSAMHVVSLTGAAVIGGYALACATAVFLGGVLPLSPLEAIMAGTLPGFAVHTAAAIWVFAVRDAKRAWITLLSAAAVLATVGMLAGDKV